MTSVIATHEGPQVRTAETPTPRVGEILVEVRAAALNRVDLRMATGAGHGAAGGPGRTLGLEWAGEIVALGEGVRGRSPGDRVMGNSPGAFADYVVAPAGSVFTVPDSLEWADAAALPVGLQTMHDALVTRGAFSPGQSVLIQGASSAMGLIGLQIARELGASLVVATTTKAAKRERLEELADLVVDSTSPHWVDEVLHATDDEGVDVILDLVAGPLATQNLHATRIGGRIVNIGRVGGERVELDLDAHSMRRITYVGTTFRTRTPEELAEVVADAEAVLGDAVKAGRIRVPVSETFALGEVRTALEAMARNSHFGKLVVIP